MAGGKEHLFLSCCISQVAALEPKHQGQAPGRRAARDLLFWWLLKAMSLKVNPLPAFPSSNHPSGSPEVSDGSLTDFSCSQDNQKERTRVDIFQLKFVKLELKINRNPKSNILLPGGWSGNVCHVPEIMFSHLFTCHLCAWVTKMSLREIPWSHLSIQTPLAQVSSLSTGLSQLCLLRPCSRAVQNVVRASKPTNSQAHFSSC